MINEKDYIKPEQDDNEEQKSDENKEQNKDAAVKPDPETLHTTDPQEHMEGPISSLMHKAGKGFDSDQTKEEADEKKDNAM
ncbi:MAG: hypothetical protein ABIT58_08160 [Ferruginibacter sp.]